MWCCQSERLCLIYLCVPPETPVEVLIDADADPAGDGPTARCGETCRAVESPVACHQLVHGHTFQTAPPTVAVTPDFACHSAALDWPGLVPFRCSLEMRANSVRYRMVDWTVDCSAEISFQGFRPKANRQTLRH